MITGTRTTSVTYGVISPSSIKATVISPHTLITGRPGLGKTVVPVTLPEKERLMFLDWILFAYPETAGKAELLPTPLLWEMYMEVAPGGKDWELFVKLVQFIREAERNTTKARRVRDLVMEYGDSSENTYLNPGTPYSKAVTSQQHPFSQLKGKLMRAFKDNYTYADLIGIVWYVTEQLMIMRDPHTKAALIKRIEGL